MGMTLSEKIIAKACGQKTVRPGEIVTCAVDLAMTHDSSGARRQWPRLKELGIGVWDPDKVVVITDHYVPAVDAVSAGILKITRDWVAEEKIPHFYDHQGICHIVLPERGHLKPGMFVVGGDSHSCTGGAFGTFTIGVGATDMTGVLATGEIWVQVPPTILITWSGKLSPTVTAKDMMLALCARIGLNGANYKVCEFAGDTVAALPMDERMVLPNMTAEVGAKTGMIAPDEVTVDYLRTAGADTEGALDWYSDDDCTYESVLEFDAATLAPQVAAPHSPANARDAGEYAGVTVDQAYIGACTGAKLADLHMAAEVLRGRKVADGTRFLVAPASTRITGQAAADGTLATLMEAGAILLPSGCGACAGLGAGILSEKEVCISSTNRNFQGRMGAASAEVYLGSPYSVAAAAVAGRIIDPREVLAEKAA
jgi:3-isopropylmalate/(R)-2-methylmalate dehydratase large subunit